MLAAEGVEDTSSPGDFVAVDAQMLKDYDDNLRDLNRRQRAPRSDWMGNVLPPMLYVSLTYRSAVADPGFHRGGGANPGGGRRPITWPIFPKTA